MNGQRPTPWLFAPLTPHQLARRAAQESAMRAGTMARWPAGCTHLTPAPKP